MELLKGDNDLIVKRLEYLYSLMEGNLLTKLPEFKQIPARGVLEDEQTGLGSA